MFIYINNYYISLEGCLNKKNVKKAILTSMWNPERSLFYYLLFYSLGAIKD